MRFYGIKMFFAVIIFINTAYELYEIARALKDKQRPSSNKTACGMELLAFYQLISGKIKSTLIQSASDLFF
ncbi:MAG: hypothetical protein J6C96_03925 [Oscillospiraceae bacterium]|nr:hypothetical protein [Oscillospiraceae bacterium]